MKEMHYTV